MVDPLLALEVFGALVLLAALVLWPRVGLVARVRAVRRLTDRVRIEDALKALHNQEYQGRVADVDAVAGALEIGRASAARLTQRLADLGLAEGDGHRVRLTEEGRAYALRVLRTHRLWERYLADRTGVHPSEWHALAEEREHTLTSDEAESLAQSLGRPLYDPHGDPIPTAEGEMPPSDGIPLTSLAPGETARIVHMEDEPPEVYRALVDRGLSVAMRVQLLESRPERVRFLAGGHEHELEPVVAANLTVQPAPGIEVPGSRAETLADLGRGEAGRVLRIGPACQGPQRRRLLDLGLVQGTIVRAEFRSASGDPVAYRIRGALVALRREQAGWVQIERLSGARPEAAAEAGAPVPRRAS